MKRVLLLAAAVSVAGCGASARHASRTVPTNQVYEFSATGELKPRSRKLAEQAEREERGSLTVRSAR
jgi:hypothetical protein